MRVGVRLGYASRALLYGIISVGSLTLALGGGGETQGSNGALRTLAGQPFGSVLLWLVTFGLASYALWRFTQVVTTSDDNFAKNTWMRFYYGIRGALYALLAWSAFGLVSTAGSSGGGGQSRDSMTAMALEWPGGRWLVGAIGLGIIGYGLWNGYRAVTRQWEDDLDTEAMSSTMQTGVDVAGIAGFLARGVLFGVIGWYLVQGAIDYEPDNAMGIDGALGRLASTAYGPWFLGITAIGLLGFAAFSLAEAFHRRIDT